MNVRIAVAQPLAFEGNETKKNLEQALQFIDRAADKGASLICFPEMYPGPYAHSDDNYNPIEEISSKCRERKIFAIPGGLEKSGDAGAYYVVQRIVNDNGEVVGTYRRTTPEGPYIYHDIKNWGFDYVTGDVLKVYDTHFGKIGVLICSEVYAPELGRILALKGAEIIFYPAGEAINELIPTWKIMVRARAIENLAYTVACQNLYGVEEGVGIIAGPEGVVAEKSDSGLMVADLDLARIRWLREQNEKVETPKKYKVVPGTLKWHKAKLYRENYKDW